MRNVLIINFLLSIGTALVASLVPPAISFSAGSPQSPQSPSYDGEKVIVVDLIARPTLDIEALRPLVQQKAGAPYSTAKIRDTAAALEKTGLFSRIDIEVTPEAAGLRVVFVLQPAYYIGMIDFPGGLDAFSYPRLLQVVNYPRASSRPAGGSIRSRSFWRSPPSRSCNTGNLRFTGWSAAARPRGWRGAC